MVIYMCLLGVSDVKGGSMMTESPPRDDVKTFLINLDKDDGTGYAPMDYRPMWEGEILVGFEVFYYEQPLAS